ncbi:MAG: DUF3019 domain-containing protein [Pseudoalteromonas sp.]
MKLFLLILVVGCLLVWPNFGVSKAASLNVTPKVCVISDQQDFCDLELNFDWKIAEPLDVCLYQDSEQLFCWQQAQLGRFNYKARVQVETLYSLINPHTGDLLATARIEVQSTQAKTTRRRLRSPWSFF